MNPSVQRSHRNAQTTTRRRPATIRRRCRLNLETLEARTLLSATLYSSFVAPFFATPLVFAGLLDGLVRFGAVMVRDIGLTPSFV